ncbi:MAG: DUF433 domain-containing protein [Egibacteraceae bacterium]
MCHGQPCVKGTRVLVTVLLDALTRACRPPRSFATTRRSPKRTCERQQPPAPGWRSRRSRAALRLMKIKLDFFTLATRRTASPTKS